MLSRIVTAKLKQSRRLVIPNLGLFVVRDDGRILFSELMRNDDGVMREAVASELGLGEAEAARIIERFVADIHYSLEHGMSYRLEGLGVLLRDDRGLVVFRSREEEMQRHSAERPVHGTLAQILAESARTEPVAEPQPQLQSEPQPQPQPEPQPEPNAVPEVGTLTAKSEPQPRPKPVRPKRKAGKQGTDMFLVVAIVIAVVAIAVIAYGMWVANSIDDGTRPEPTEQPADSDEVDLSIPSGNE